MIIDDSVLDNCKISDTQLLDTIDHSILKPNTTEKDIIRGIEIGVKFGVRTLCIMPNWVKRCSEIQKQNAISSVPICTVIGFPLGYATKESKLYEAHDAIQNGAEELDIVIDLNKVLSGKWLSVAEDLGDFQTLCKKYSSESTNITPKIIFETCYLEAREIITLCQICSEVMDYGYVKTSTGFGTGGATIDNVKLMREYTKRDLDVKAAGGIKTKEQIIGFYNAGASRIGCSSTEQIFTDLGAK